MIITIAIEQWVVTLLLTKWAPQTCSVNKVCDWVESQSSLLELVTFLPNTINELNILQFRSLWQTDTHTYISSGNWTHWVNQTMTTVPNRFQPHVKYMLQLLFKCPLNGIDHVTFQDLTLSLYHHWMLVQPEVPILCPHSFVGEVLQRASVLGSYVSCLPLEVLLWSFCIYYDRFANFLVWRTCSWKSPVYLVPYVTFNHNLPLSPVFFTQSVALNTVICLFSNTSNDLHL